MPPTLIFEIVYKIAALKGRFFFFYGFSDASETHRSVIFRIPFRPRSGRRAFATIFCDFGEKVAQLAGLIFSKSFF